ncbi:MAG: ComEA family DNA-binding protein [Fretibacterium sp.]|nr:ComEA family DNA-binding protein [Fretibacterium sp.]
MWKWLWEEHRSGIYAVAGAILFLVSGMAVSFYSSGRGAGQGEPQSRNMRDSALTSRENVPVSGGAKKQTDESLSRVLPEPAPQPEPKADWYLYITGSVRNPGVYQLPPNSRLFQLVDAAGGFDGFADRVAVNLAEPLKDGQHVHVPNKGERRAADRSGGGGAQSRETVIITQREAPSNWGLQASGSGSAHSRVRIDINHAPESDLVRLRGIGPTLARRIVEYRQQHGPFRSVEELVQVRGIGAAKINGLREQAAVNP